MAPYYDDTAVIAGLVVVGVMLAFLTVLWLKTRQAPKSLLATDSIPSFDPVSPAVAWMIVNRDDFLTLSGKGPMGLSMARMVRQGYMTFERRGIDPNNRPKLFRTDREEKYCGLFVEERELGKNLFKRSQVFAFGGMDLGLLHAAHRDYRASLNAQCKGVYYKNNWRWIWIESGIAIALCVFYAMWFTPTDEIGLMAGLGFILGGLATCPWLISKYVTPHRLWGAVATLALLTFTHMALSWLTVNRWADAEALQQTVAQGLPVIPPLHPAVLVGLWLTGLGIIGWEWLRTFTPKGHVIFSALMDARNRERQGLQPRHEPIVNWGGEQTDDGLAQALTEAATPEGRSADADGVRTGLRIAVTDAYLDGLWGYGNRADTGRTALLDFDISSALHAVSGDGGDGGDGGGDGSGD